MGIYYFENDLHDKFGSIFHCLWWATVTLTSVGYGDAYPITIGGKIFTSIIIIIGIGIIAVPTGLIASAMTKISMRIINKLNNSIIVVGGHRFLIFSVYLYSLPAACSAYFIFKIL